jgi:hypothetical protein
MAHIYLPLNASISLNLVPKSWFNSVLFPAQKARVKNACQANATECVQKHTIRPQINRFASWFQRLTYSTIFHQGTGSTPAAHDPSKFKLDFVEQLAGRHIDIGSVGWTKTDRRRLGMDG